jgi:Ca2+-binding EF-hand superfamily protein
MAAFKYFDSDNCGYITANSVIETLKINDIPIDEDGLINFFEKYYKLEKKLTYKEFNILFDKRV